MPRHSVATLLFVAVLWPASRAAEDPRNAPAASEASIAVRPKRVYANALVALTLKTHEPLSLSARISWTASRGLLHWDDLPEVYWRAPAHPGPARVAVRAETRDRTISAELEIEVLAPSTEGMVWIPPGVFIRGDYDGTADPYESKTLQNDNDEPVHEACLDGYWIDRHPVTNEEFARFLDEARAEGLVRPEPVAAMGEFEGEWVPFYYFQPYSQLVIDFYDTRNARRPYFLFLISWDGERFRVRPGFERHPVADVTWFGATAYASYYGKRLPSEAQWEKAARGTDGRRYPWGENVPSAYHTPQDEDLSLAPVGSYSPLGDSPYGVADTLAGGFEWTGDWFNPDSYRDYFGPAPHRNPRGTFWGRSHSIRGFPTDLSPNAKTYRIPTPLSIRYEWILDHMLGDCFGNRTSTFRTVVAPGDLLGSATQGRFPEPVSTAEAARAAAQNASPMPPRT
ncbi:MAG: formylglycine-generating enzyme family protein [Planctomycetota bacterium]